MTDIRQPDAGTSEQALEDLFANQLATKPLDPAALARVHRAVRDEWEAQALPIATRARSLGRRALWSTGIALAAMLALVAGITLFMHPAPAGEMVGSLADTRGGTLEEANRFFGHRTVRGGAIRVGDTFTARGDILILLTHGGTLRVADGTVITVAAGSQLQLEHGMLYVDKPAGLPVASRLRVATRAGLIEHVGTEFEVRSDDRMVQIRVREGQVRFSSAIGVQLASAGTQLTATDDGQVARRPIPTFGRDWQWMVALAPEFAVEGRSLEDYLQWISRELGRPIVFADPGARASAEHTILHGAIHSPATLDALDEVLSSTSLTYELADGVIRVHSSR